MIQITPGILAALSPKENPKLIAPIATAMNEFFPRYEITTEKRVEHFLAQACHESDGFKTLTEYASGDAYDTRTDLGNTPQRDGDGKRYKGRGIFQTTGRTNYAAAGKEMGLDLIARPELLAEPRNAVWAACIYWKSRRLNALADRDDLRAITKKVNGGYNGLADRQRYLDKARPLIKSTQPDTDRIGPGSDRDLVKALQKLLAQKKYPAGRIDGLWGKMTRDAVLAFKADNAMDVSDPTVTLAEVAAAPDRKLETREDATVADLREAGSETVKGADQAQIAGTVGVVAPAAGWGASWLSKAQEYGDQWWSVRTIVEPFQDFLGWIQDKLWLILPAIGAAALYYGYRAKKKRLEDFKTGKVS